MVTGRSRLYLKAPHQSQQSHSKFNKTINWIYRLSLVLNFESQNWVPMAMSTITLSLFSLISVLVVILLGTDISNVQLVQAGNPNYRDALAKSILFFQGQRSGKLPSGPAQQITWRSNSGLSDGRLVQVNGYICFCFFNSYLLKYVLLKEKNDTEKFVKLRWT